MFVNKLKSDINHKDNHYKSITNLPSINSLPGLSERSKSTTKKRSIREWLDGKKIKPMNLISKQYNTKKSTGSNSKSDKKLSTIKKKILDETS